MFKIFKTLIVILVLTVIPFSICSAQEITNYNDIIENGKELNEKKIVIKGEAIKEAMKRGEYCWVNVGDGNTAMGIWVKASEAEKISLYGDYKHRGDMVKVTGTFNRACSEHGGDMDIHAESIEVNERGREVARSLDYGKLKKSLLLTAITAILALSYYIISREKRRN